MVAFNFRAGAFAYSTLLVFSVVFALSMVLLLLFPPAGVMSQIDKSTIPAGSTDCSTVKCVPCVCLGEVTFWSFISSLCFLAAAYLLGLFVEPMAKFMGFM